MFLTPTLYLEANFCITVGGHIMLCIEYFDINFYKNNEKCVNELENQNQIYATFFLSTPT